MAEIKHIVFDIGMGQVDDRLKWPFSRFIPDAGGSADGSSINLHR